MSAQMSPQVNRSGGLQVQVHHKGPQRCGCITPGSIPHRGALPPRKRRCNQCSGSMYLMEVLHVKEPAVHRNNEAMNYPGTKGLLH